jgi:hypothetical protein
MEKTILDGLTVVDAPLPYGVNGVYVNERDLTEQIDELWAARQTFNGAIRSQKSQMRSMDATLAEMLYTMKAVLSKPGRSGGWSEFLRDRRIASAVADRLVARYQRKLGQENSPRGAIQEPTEGEVQKIFAAAWVRLQKRLTTQESAYWFICNLALESGARHELREGGIFAFDSPSEALEETSTVAVVAAVPITTEAVAGAGNINEVIL